MTYSHLLVSHDVGARDVRDGYPLRAVAALAVVGAAVAIAVARRGEHRFGAWYGRLRKSALTPPPPVFGAVWPALYALLALAGVYIFVDARRARALSALFAAQLAANVVWPALFARMRRFRVALVDLLVTFALTVALIDAASRQGESLLAAALVPYALWLAFAAYLNAVIVVCN